MYASSGKQVATYGDPFCGRLEGEGGTIVHALSAVVNCSAVRSRADAHAIAVPQARVVYEVDLVVVCLTGLEESAV